MKMKDVKVLWGRSGNRCAFPGCKIELTPDGSKSTLGEMAHIVADSPDGPRGENEKDLDLIESFIKRFVNYYGLTIDSIFNEDGTLALPRRLSC